MAGDVGLIACFFCLRRMRFGGETSSAPPSPQYDQSPNPGIAETGTVDPSGLREQNGKSPAETIKMETDDTIGDDEKQAVALSKKPLPPDPASNLDLSRSMWTPIMQDLESQLRHHAWEIRHGSALALQDLIRFHGETYGMMDYVTEAENILSRENHLGSMAAALLELLAVDRFGDFVGDQVVAPVREAGSQALACLLRHLGVESIAAIHTLLLRMILQDWRAVPMPGDAMTKGRYAWEVRHAGLLGLKYELAVRPDLIAGETAMAKTYVEGVLQGSLLG